MSESYVECMVQRKNSFAMSVLKYLLIILTIISFIGFLINSWLVFAALLFGVLAYFASLRVDTEYEYLYIDKEIVVDRIFHKTNRKRFATYSLEKIEIMAPVNSWHLDGYKNRTFKEEDISSGIVKQPDTRYLFYYDGQKKVIFEPNAEMIKVIRNVAPRKVFVD